MSTQLILWTLIPCGLADDGERLKFSIFISPKLNPQADPERLDTFPDFVVWPKLLNELKLGVEFSNGEQLEAERDPDSLQADADLWQELFLPETFVRNSGQTTLHQRLIHTYHVRDTLGFLKQTYKAIGLANPDALPGLPILGNNQADPTLRRFIELLGPNRGVIAEKMEKQMRLRHNEAIRSAMKQNQVNALNPDLSAAEVAALGFNSQQEFDFYLAQRFYQRPETEPQPSDYLEKPDITKVPPPIKPPELDFHQMLTLLTDHFTLMRRFGVVVDVITKRPDNLPATGWVRPLVEQPANIGKGTPRTQYQLDKFRFLPAPQSSGPASDMRNGMLKLRQVNDRLESNNKEQLFDLLLVDADGAALKANNFALSSARLGALDGFAEPHLIPYDTPQEAGLPSLQTHGIGLARRGRAFMTAQRLKAMATRNSNPSDPNALLFADDLLRGYRPDVMDTTAGDWRSLTARIGAYLFLNSNRSKEIAEEGYVKAASTTSADDQNSDLYLHEVLFKWAGWSLAAPRPGKTFRPQTSGLQQAEVVEDVPNTATTEFKLETSMRVQPGTLPRLRFGRAYRLRARAVDLAGNSVSEKAIDDDETSAAILFTRFEPVTPPAVMLRDAVTEGESVEHLVIRSNYDQSAEDYVADPDVVAALQGKPHTYTVESARHIAPPKTSQIMAEMHGMFDVAIGAGSTPAQRAAAYATATREAGTYYDVLQAQLVTPPELQGQPGVITTLPPAPPSVSNPAGERLAAGQYVIYPSNATLPLPYLPDVFARGAAFRFVPGVSASAPLGPSTDTVKLPDGSFALRVSFDGDWPDSLPFRLRIMERAGTMDEATCQENFVALPEPMWAEDERLLTVFLPKATVAKVRYSCTLTEKDLEHMGIWQWLRESATEAQLKALTGLAEGGALWMVTPYRELTLVHAVQQPLCAPRFLKLGPRRQLGDTFTRFTGAMRLSAKSTSKIDVMAKWKEPVDNLADPGPKVVEGAARAFEMKIDPASPDDQNLPRVSEKHEFGDTKHRLVEYRITGTTRFREYFPPEITADPANITRTGESWQPVVKQDGEGNVTEAGMHIPSSARPDSPKLVYIVPTFKWNRAWSGRTYTSTRLGGGLRVYVERTWYSSGADELLGVLLPGSNPITDDALKPYVTRWGKDPITDSGKIDLSPLPSDFQAEGIQTGTNLRLAELPKDVTAVGHPAYYDAARKLWYADVVMNPRQMYYPFVRLALARYQPFSLNTAHLSRVVLADFAQLPPTRSLSVKVGQDLRTLTVSINGIAPKETSTSKAIKTDPQPGRVKPLPTNPQEGLNQFVVSVERRDVAIADADLGWDPEPLASISKSRSRGLSVISPVTNVINVGIIGGVIVPFLSLWSGTVVLPEPINQKRYRLAVRELETHYADAFGQWLNKKVDRSRLVYAETVELTPELGLTG